MLIYTEKLKGFAGKVKEERSSIELSRFGNTGAEDEVRKAEIIERNKARKHPERTDFFGERQHVC